MLGKCRKIQPSRISVRLWGSHVLKKVQFQIFFKWKYVKSKKYHKNRNLCASSAHNSPHQISNLSHAALTSSIVSQSLSDILYQWVLHYFVNTCSAQEAKSDVILRQWIQPWCMKTGLTNKCFVVLCANTYCTSVDAQLVCNFIGVRCSFL